MALPSLGEFVDADRARLHSVFLFAGDVQCYLWDGWIGAARPDGMSACPYVSKIGDTVDADEE